MLLTVTTHSVSRIVLKSHSPSILDRLSSLDRASSSPIRLSIIVSSLREERTTRRKTDASLEASRLWGSAARVCWHLYFRGHRSDAKPIYIGRRLYVYRDLS